jgi:hypothetical protein
MAALSASRELRCDEEKVRTAMESFKEEIPPGLELALAGFLKRNCTTHRRNVRVDVVGNIGEALGRMLRCASQLESTVLQQKARVEQDCRKLREREIEGREQTDARIAALDRLAA